MCTVSLENSQKRYHDFIVGVMPFNNPERSPMLPYTRPIPRKEAVDRFLMKNKDCRNFRRDIMRIYNIRKLEKQENGKGRGKGRTGVLLTYEGEKSTINRSKE